MELTSAEVGAIHSTMVRLETRWHRPFDAGEWYAYDPLPPAEFLPDLRRAAGLATGRRFLDVGCGIGRNMAIAFSLGLDVSGIEHYEPYATAAKDLLPEAHVLCADALDIEEFDCDILYMYRPARDDDLQTKLERRILERVLPGTVMFWPLRGGVWVA